MLATNCANPKEQVSLGVSMKAKIWFFVNFLIVACLFSQAASADGTAWLVHPIDEPVYLSVCGAALLLLGTYKGRRTN
ncbi:MAG: hypothetical protein ACI9Y1_001783 [Lentisphaeria bacterium]